MTYDSERAKLARRPALLVELVLDKCANIYGQTFSNLLNDPEDILGAGWSITASPIRTANVAAAPDGTITADSIEDDNTGAAEGIFQTQTGTYNVGAFYNLSVFILKDQIGRGTRAPTLWLEHFGSTTEISKIGIDTATGEFNLVGFAGANATAQVEDVGDYWRASLSCQSVDGLNTNCRAVFRPAEIGSIAWAESSFFTGTVTVWGFQLSEGATLATYGAGTCTAAGGPGAECFNTRATCQDTPNYNPKLPTTIRFSDVLIPGEKYLHCVRRAQLAPTVINPQKGLGVRASIKIDFDDFAYHDRGLDPYLANRTYDPADQGTFFGRLIARNVHYNGRILRVRSGYLADAGFNLADFQSRTYVIESIVGPDGNGRVTIVAKDILKLADDARAEAPAASTGALEAGIGAGATSLTVTAGTEGEYNLEGDYIRVNDEIILAPVANRSANVFSNLSRGQFNTADAPHGAGDSVQACKHLNAVNPVDLVDDLLKNYAGVSADYIDAAVWADERDTWFNGNTINTLIPEPTGVAKLINELAEQYFFRVWWNEIEQLINLRAVVPDTRTTIPQWSDDNQLLEKTVAVERADNKRVSRVIYYYNPRNPIETDDPEDYQALYVTLLADEESAALFGDVRRRVVFARFVNAESIAVQTASRILARFRQTPIEATLEVDAKNADIWTGDFFELDTRRLQSEQGANLLTRFQILSVEEKTAPLPGTRFKIKGQSLNFPAGVRYAYVGPNTLGDYTAETAANKARYSFVAPNSGNFPSDNGSPYLIL